MNRVPVVLVVVAVAALAAWWLREDRQSVVDVATPDVVSSGSPETGSSSTANRQRTGAQLRDHPERTEVTAELAACIGWSPPAGSATEFTQRVARALAARLQGLSRMDPEALDILRQLQRLGQACAGLETLVAEYVRADDARPLRRDALRVLVAAGSPQGRTLAVELTRAEFRGLSNARDTAALHFAQYLVEELAAKNIAESVPLLMEIVGSELEQPVDDEDPFGSEEPGIAALSRDAQRKLAAVAVRALGDIDASSARRELVRLVESTHALERELGLATAALALRREPNGELADKLSPWAMSVLSNDTSALDGEWGPALEIAASTRPLEAAALIENAVSKITDETSYTNWSRALIECARRSGHDGLELVRRFVRSPAFPNARVDPSGELRSAAFGVLLAHGDSQDHEWLRARAASSDGEERALLLRLRPIDPWRGHELELEALIDKSLASTDDPFAAAAAREAVIATAELGGASDRLRALARHHDASIAALAVRKLDAEKRVNAAQLTPQAHWTALVSLWATARDAGERQMLRDDARALGAKLELEPDVAAQFVGDVSGPAELRARIATGALTRSAADTARLDATVSAVLVDLALPREDSVVLWQAVFALGFGGESGRSRVAALFARDVRLLESAVRAVACGDLVQQFVDSLSESIEDRR